ncbi:MAG: hypothetical protein QOK43_1526 [Acidimicrobiaceae bacterium]|nr:hypothetical protein [Acidimicrobiaceae bacterium]
MSSDRDEPKIRRPSHPRPRPLRARRHLDPVSADERQPDKRQQQKAQRREELLDALSQAIRTHGAGLSMEEMAAAAGVTKPILYRHFGDRGGLVLALAERFSVRLMADLQQVLSRPTDNPRDTLVGTIDAFIRFLERDPEVYRFLVQRAVSGGDEAAAAALDGFLRRIGQEVAVVLGEQLHAAGRDAGGAEPLAHGIVGFVYGAGDWWVERRSMSRARLVEYLANTLWSGFEGMGVVGAPADSTDNPSPHPTGTGATGTTRTTRTTGKEGD